MSVVSRASIIGAIIRKDMREFSRDRFFLYMTVAGLAAYIALFWLLPSTVNETIKIGVHQSGMEQLFEQAEEANDVGIEFVQFSSSEDLRGALGVSGEGVEDSLQVGLDFPTGFLEKVALGEETTVQVYVDPAVPDEIRAAMSSFVREIAFALTGNALPVTQPEQETIILGEDRAGAQVPFREKLAPLLAFFVLLMEMISLGSLVAIEVQTRTVSAVLVTPTTTADFLAAKGILGTLFAFGQVVLLMIAIRALSNNPLLLITVLLLGSVLVTGLALIVGSSGKDFIGTLFYGMLFLLPLAIPAFSVLFPGTASAWVQVMPSYGLVQTIVGVTSHDLGWSGALPHLGTLLAWCLAIFGIGWFALRRKVESL